MKSFDENDKEGRWLRICGNIRAKLFINSIKSRKGVFAGIGENTFLRLLEENGRNYIEFGTNHHGVRFDCTNVNGEFEKIIEKLRKEYPENIID